jgi:hypothetical protein
MASGRSATIANQQVKKLATAALTCKSIALLSYLHRREFFGCRQMVCLSLLLLLSQSGARSIQNDARRTNIGTGTNTADEPASGTPGRALIVSVSALMEACRKRSSCC